MKMALNTTLTDRLPYWLMQCGQSAYLKNVVKLEVLRKWSLSEVLRLTSDDDSIVIAKISRGVMSSELDIYNDILIPANVDAPTILESFRTDIGSIMLMEDLGYRTVEKEPRHHYFIEAARQLARIHLSVSNHIKRGDISYDSLQRHYVPKEQYLEDISYLITLSDSRLADYKEILRRVPNILDRNLNLLYTAYPVTIIHNDYHSKNLIIRGNRIVPIDWSIAYLSPHLGDLYCIVQEASDYNVSETDLIRAYFSIVDPNHTRDNATYQWQVDIGALCWEVRALRWVMEFGVNAISEAREWIPDFGLSIRDIIDRPTLHAWKSAC